jgi:two-component system response regulator NreC
MDPVKPRVRLLICDDHELFREGVKAILRQEPAIEVVGEARDGREAVDKALQLRPDVVLMDMEMPDLNGLEATRRIRHAEPAVKVLILTMYAEDELVARCLEAGASGYVLKDIPVSQLVYALQAVSKGGKYMSPAALEGMVERYVGGQKRTETRYDLLTDREREVLKLLADGLSPKEIAARLGLSLKTVDVHKTNLMRKLDIHTRAGLVKYAIENKLIRLRVMK